MNYPLYIDEVAGSDRVRAPCERPYPVVAADRQ